MNVVILGAGDVGYGVAKQLSFDENNVSVIDNCRDTLKKVSDKLDIKPVFGHASDVSALIEAGIEGADILVAATSSDETNIVACQIADFMFKTEMKIARISNKFYLAEMYNIFGKNKLSVDLIASPAIEVSSIIRRGVSTYGAIDIIQCMNDKLKIVGIKCSGYSAFVNVPMKFIQNVSSGLDMAVLFIERNGKSFLPCKTDVISNGDNVFCVIKSSDIVKLMNLFGYIESDSNKAVIIGGGVIGEELVRSILEEHSDVSIKIIEKDILRAEKLSEDFDDVEVLYGDALDTDVLKSAISDDTNVAISVTNDIKVNILSCLLSKQFGAKRVAAMVNDASSASLLNTLGITTILDSRQAVISKILRYIKKGGVEKISTLCDDSIEMLAVDVSDNSRAIGLLTDDISSKDHVIVAVLMRENEIHMLPKGFVISSGDKILFSATKESIVKISELFKEKPQYLV